MQSYPKPAYKKDSLSTLIRSFSQVNMSSQVELDPYLAQAQNDDVTPAQKIEGMCSPPKEVHASLIS